MNTTHYVVTDTLTGRTVELENIHELFYAPPDVVRKASEDLVRKVNRGEYTGEEEAFLGVRVTPRG